MRGLDKDQDDDDHDDEKPASPILDFFARPQVPRPTVDRNTLVGISSLSRSNSMAK